jgi:hypothetical protein
MTGAGPCLPPERLAEFYAGALTESEQDAVREHLSTCTICLEVARDARAFVEAMEPLGPATWRRPSRWTVLAAAAVLAGIALISASAHLLRRGGGESDVATRLVVVPAPYAAAGDDLVWRDGGESPGTDPLDAAASRYRAGDYPGAVTDLAAYVATHGGDPRGLFYLGVARLLTGEAGAAADDLAAAAAMPGAPPEAGWYLALARIKAGDRVRAREELGRVATSGSLHREEARRLLERLDEEGPP